MAPRFSRSAFEFHLRSAVRVVSGTAVLALVACGGGDDGGGPVVPPQNHPLPTLATLAPAEAIQGAESLTLRVTGSDFVRGAAIHWNGTERVTTFVSSTALSTTLTSADLAAVASASITVVNPAPGGGRSNALTFVIGTAAPRITRLVAGGHTIGDPSPGFFVQGANFSPRSVVRWNGQDRPTSYQGSTVLHYVPPADALAATGTYEVTVHTPAPGGGTSSPATFTVVNPVPVLSTISPTSSGRSSEGLTLTVTGDRFVSGAGVHWDGQPRPTTMVSTTTLTATISAADLEGTGTVNVTVVNLGPGGGTSDPQPFHLGIAEVRKLSLRVRDLVWDPARARLYASIAPGDASHTDAVVRIDPATGDVDGSVTVGPSPGRLAISDDGAYLYVVIEGRGGVRRVDLTTLTAGPEFAMPGAVPITSVVTDLAVLPGQPTSVVVARRGSCCPLQYPGVQVYDDGIPRAAGYLGPAGPTVIEVASATTVYGIDGDQDASLVTNFANLAIGSGGITEQSLTPGVVTAANLDMAVAGGRVFLTDGTVFDPVTRGVLGKLALTGVMGDVSVAADAVNGKVYFLPDVSTSIQVFGTADLSPMGTIRVPPPVTPAEGSLVRWGVDGLAYRTDSEVVILRTELVTR